MILNCKSRVFYKIGHSIAYKIERNRGSILQALSHFDVFEIFEHYRSKYVLEKTACLVKEDAKIVSCCFIRNETCNAGQKSGGTFEIPFILQTSFR